ncbi:pollen-specific leucine-rich repeat extensin-like protein 4 isoform X2 [Vigna angularis]|uniref:pollen-specific leucine-rich repeat extensin-like protein 4 isoform X2 n=1 Tax=Phaseolus angularis TaxID=3914 RepID=UPI0022B2ACC2|nr:pollen-specific leucine-rich repeat extensin-like protein 4 isoform X2 [Vigna angularis]
MAHYPNYRGWMYDRCYSGRRGLKESFVIGVEEFVETARRYQYYALDGGIRCPCIKCECTSILKDEVVKVHLYQKGFMPNYTVWTFHGEEIPSTSTAAEKRLASVMTGQGSERPDKGKGVARPTKRKRQAPKYVLRVPARLPTPAPGSSSSVGPPPTPSIQTPTPAVDPTPPPRAVHPSTTTAVDPSPPPAAHASTTPAADPLPPPLIATPTPPPIVITPTPLPDPTSIPSSSSVPPSETVTPLGDPDSSGDDEDLDPPLHDRPWIEPYGKGFIPSRVASQAITRSIKQQFLTPWPTWGAIPHDDRKSFWQRFQVSNLLH